MRPNPCAAFENRSKTCCDTDSVCFRVNFRVSIKKITKDDRKLTRPRLETAQFEDAAIIS